MVRPWGLDFSEASNSGLPDPPGFSEKHYTHSNDSSDGSVTKKVDLARLKLKKAHEVAWSPAKNFMMTGFMLWMSGNGVHIFSIMITFYAIYNPIKSACSVNTQFARFHDPKYTSSDLAQLTFAKVTFVAMNMLAMSGALYKMSLMGLLPTTPSDWVSFLDVAPAVQFASGGVAR